MEFSMAKKNKVPPPDKQPDESLENDIDGDDMTAHVIDEEDFDTQLPENIEYLPDSETEVLPTSVEKELVEEWRKIQESESGYLPDNEPQEPTDSIAADDELPETVDSILEADEPQDDTIVEDEPAQATAPTPSRPPLREPSKPAWKIHAEQMFAEREAAKQKLWEERQQFEESQRGNKEQQVAQLREHKAESDAEVQAKVEALRKEKEAALEAMVERIREENERKRLEREAVDEQLRKEREARNYKANRDVDNRASRLSKKEDK
jgi:hypothetical protein